MAGIRYVNDETTAFESWYYQIHIVVCQIGLLLLLLGFSIKIYHTKQEEQAKQLIPNDYLHIQ